jgi:hypothetical protein
MAFLRNLNLRLFLLWISWQQDFYGVGLQTPRPTSYVEDQASVSVTPEDRVTQLHPQALGTYFSRLLRHAWATLGLLLSSGHHTETVNLYCNILMWLRISIHVGVWVPALQAQFTLSFCEVLLRVQTLQSCQESVFWSASDGISIWNSRQYAHRGPFLKARGAASRSLTNFHISKPLLGFMLDSLNGRPSCRKTFVYTWQYNRKTWG